MSEQENKELMERGYAAFSAGDLDTVMSLFDDDCEWVQPGQSAVSGTFHGKTEILEQFGRLAEKGLTVELKQLVAEGDTVVAITQVTAGGETSEDADVFTIRNGKTVRVQVHGDTAVLERVYGKKQLAAG
ncbi:MAG TPA: nuclear transport factor 2 family protein [Mycobacterium sp.]|jgi:ketosteroid isomerase-like protein|nr:nuclear transport factor 2 family protein [Mycobacterium sp.]